MFLPTRHRCCFCVVVSRLIWGVLRLCPQLLSCLPCWAALACSGKSRLASLALALIWSVAGSVNTKCGYRPGAVFLCVFLPRAWFRALALIWGVLRLCHQMSSASVLLAFLGPDLRCVLSLCPQLHPACGSGSLWPLFGVCPQPVSSACLLLAIAGLCGSLWPLFGMCPQQVSSGCALFAVLGRSGPDLGCVLSPCPQLVV